MVPNEASPSLNIHAFGTSGIIMIEVPEEQYLSSNLSSLKELLQNGFGGIYVSFQRPYKNLINIFKSQELDVGRLNFIDCTGDVAGISDDKHCLFLVHPKIDDLVTAIYQQLGNMPYPNHFIFVDSLSTICLYQPLSEILRLSDFLIRVVRGKSNGNILLIFNIGHALSTKKFIKNIALQVDKVIEWEHGTDH